MRRGFTVVEIIVSTIIASLVIVMAWSFFSREQSRFRSDQSRLSGLQGAMQLDEALAWDLERIALGAPGEQTYNIEHPVYIPPDGRRLDFRIFAEDAPGAVRVKSRAVTYALDERTGQVLRVEDGKTRAFPGLIAEELQFSKLPINAKPPAFFTFYPEAPVIAVKYVVICFSEALKSTPAAQRLPQDRVTLVGAVALPFRSERAHHPYWRAGACDYLEPVP